MPPRGTLRLVGPAGATCGPASICCPALTVLRIVRASARLRDRKPRRCRHAERCGSSVCWCHLWPGFDLLPGSDGAADRPGRRPACGTGSPRRCRHAERCGSFFFWPGFLSVAAVPFALAERVRCSAAALGVNSTACRDLLPGLSGRSIGSGFRSFSTALTFDLIAR